jgi:hypothetical protein
MQAKQSGITMPELYWPALTLVALGFLAFTLLGCSPSGQSEVAKNHAAAEQAAIEGARKAGTPWAAFNILNAHRRAAPNAYRTCSFADGCRPLPMSDQCRQALGFYLSAAAQAGESEALVYLFAPENADKAEYEVVRSAAAPKLLALAERAPGRAGDRRLLMTAADVLASGQAAVLDSRRAVGFYARAWAAGEPKAADRAAQVFLRINDDLNAYLWSLRCVGACVRSIGLALPEVQRKLSPQAAKQAQEAAATPSVIEIDTLGG